MGFHQGRTFNLTVGGGQQIYNFSRAIFKGDTNNTAKIEFVRISICVRNMETVFKNEFSS